MKLPWTKPPRPIPPEAVTEDRQLETTLQHAMEALARHRWHWTMDETNPQRVRSDEYAAAVASGPNRHPKYEVICAYGDGYAAWIDDKYGFTISECIDRARPSGWGGG